MCACVLVCVCVWSLTEVVGGAQGGEDAGEELQAYLDLSTVAVPERGRGAGVTMRFRQPCVCEGNIPGGSRRRHSMTRYRLNRTRIQNVIDLFNELVLRFETGSRFQF